MLPGAGVFVLALALSCLSASGAALADQRSEEVAVHQGRGSGDVEGPDDASKDEDNEENDDDNVDRDDDDHGDDNDEDWDDHGGDNGPGESSAFGVVDAESAVTRVRSLPGPDFTKGDAAWRKRLKALGKRRRHIFSSKRPTNQDAVALATAAPLTVLYVLARDHGRLFPDAAVPKLLRVHVLGAAYTFEGRGDWRLLGEAMPPGVSVEVSLVLGTPRIGDGVPEMKRMSLLKQKLCRDHGNVKVRCIESFYENVMEELDRPHLAIMFNPGFPQVHRRSWDKPLLFLLRERIPTAVSAQVTSDKGWPKAGRPWDSHFFNYGNEDFAVNTTLEAYGANVWSTTGSPFFIVTPWKEREDWIKNGVIEVFQGLRRGAAMPRPPAMPQKEVKFLKEFDWNSVEARHIDNEMRRALMTPVSDAFLRAADTVYVRFLQDAIDFGRMEGQHGYRIRGSRKKVVEEAKALLIRMKNMEPLMAKDWIFLKSALNMD